MTYFNKVGIRGNDPDDAQIDIEANATGNLIPAIFELEVVKGNVEGHTIVDNYGRNPDVDTGSAPEDIWNGGSSFTGFPTGSAETMEIRSNNTDDTSAGTGARTVTIYNLLDSTGAEMPDITVTLSGTTWVSLGAQTYYRGGTRIDVKTAGTDGENQGTLTLRHTTTTSNIFAKMPPYMNQTAVGAYTVPLGKTLYVNRVNFCMSRANGSPGSANITLRARKHGEVFQAKLAPEITHAHDYNFADNSYLIFEARTDIKGRIESVSDNNTIVTADIGGVLVDD
jgi:hypothetical protein